MQKDLNHYLKQKQRKRRFLMILLITFITASALVLIRECSQSLDEPYNKDYQPVDQSRKNNNLRDLP